MYIYIIFRHHYFNFEIEEFLFPIEFSLGEVVLISNKV